MLNITPIPALSDNYIWAIQKDNDVIIVDPSDAVPVLAFIAKNQLNLTAILLTHNHHDHTDGMPELLSRYPQLSVYGPQEAAQFANRIVQPEDHLTLFDYDVRVIESAGHTAQHVSYLFGNEYLFCGDALFSGGCGRVFTGNYQAQFDALQRFKALPEFVEIFPAHEYTLSNLKFAEAVLAPSCALFEIQERAEILRSRNQPTLPTTLERELQINPFLQAVDLDQFIALRHQKDNF
ncbi:hydroxyacylglutathione hydrolase [Actinobacillus pleuropneumoniae]|uniref:hydroxyacylglutathione hydrolase n=1 Tax=Actinobacillus pleuropneumoniae TaxID=715 RepID=UPI0001E49EB8|nr:hydroxyacylglutathione hydrolase [Actinobacillus pleuropneumoniae]EFM90406.1 Hydroxyacylglutathione hydrolase [Actinobacillus pleuropneumoniae serovar 4 str. M62]UKH40636.1 hydroxyacylglutathione hydrolase [Actinobacillus pleuropneumoniae serovar 4 str. M62]SQF64146.1 hydroxyacylglutathione hydrolase [Actinobacillus pleuropneumoniae]